MIRVALLGISLGSLHALISRGKTYRGWIDPVEVRSSSLLGPTILSITPLFRLAAFGSKFPLRFLGVNGAAHDRPHTANGPLIRAQVCSVVAIPAVSLGRRLTPHTAASAAPAFDLSI